MFRHRIFSQEYWEKNKDSIKEFAKEYEKYEKLGPETDAKAEAEPTLRSAPVASVIAVSRKQRLPEVNAVRPEGVADSIKRRKHS